MLSVDKVLLSYSSATKRLKASAKDRQRVGEIKGRVNLACGVSSIATSLLPLIDNLFISISYQLQCVQLEMYQRDTFYPALILYSIIMFLNCTYPSLHLTRVDGSIS